MYHSVSGEYLHRNLTLVDHTKVRVIASHFNEDIEWMSNQPYNAVVVSKKGIPSETPPNKGNEASSYLEYIIKHYADLREWNIFLHGHSTAWHHKQRMEIMLRYLHVGEHEYCNINDFNPVDFTTIPEYDNSKKLIAELFEILGYNHEIENIDKITYRPCSQFYVHRNLIYKHKKQTYKKLYEWIMNSPQNSYWTGRAFEYIWHIMFTGNLQDTNIQSYYVNEDDTRVDHSIRQLYNVSFV